MRSKKGEGTTLSIEEISKIVLGIFGIVILVALSVSLVGIFTEKTDYVRAERALEDIVSIAEGLERGESEEYVLEGPKDWSLVSNSTAVCFCKSESLGKEDCLYNDKSALCKNLSQQVWFYFEGKNKDDKVTCNARLTTLENDASSCLFLSTVPVGLTVSTILSGTSINVGSVGVGGGKVDDSDSETPIMNLKGELNKIILSLDSPYSEQEVKDLINRYVGDSNKRWVLEIRSIKVGEELAGNFVLEKTISNFEGDDLSVKPSGFYGNTFSREGNDYVVAYSLKVE